MWRYFLTPEDVPTGTRVIALTIPSGDEWEALIRGALVDLLRSENFVAFGSLTPDETVEYFIPALLDTLEGWSDCP